MLHPNNPLGTRENIHVQLSSDPVAQACLAQWCAMNDSIVPIFVTRNTWNSKQRANQLMVPILNGKKQLYIPPDIHLWEIPRLIAAVDQDTFSDNPIKQKEAVEKLRSTGQLFRNAGLYFRRYLPNITEGKEIATQVANDFLEYGMRLLENTVLPTDELTTTATPPKFNLTSAETEEVERWLLDRLGGDSALYEQWQQKADKKKDHSGQHQAGAMEQERIRVLRWYFRILQRGWAKEQGEERVRILRETVHANVENTLELSDEERRRLVAKVQAWELYRAYHNYDPVRAQELAPLVFSRKPWLPSGSTAQRILNQQRDRAQATIKQPARELQTVFFRRGLKQVREGIFYPPAREWHEHGKIREEEARLVTYLDLPMLKQRLEAVRKSQDISAVVHEELAIVDTIQAAVAKIPYQLNNNNPSQILKDQTLNCVGYSMLGASLLEEIGIRYRYVNTIGHAVLLVVTSDNKIHWRDLQDPQCNIELSDNMVAKITSDTSDHMSLQDLANNESAEAILDLTPDAWQQVGQMKVFSSQFLHVFPDFLTSVTSTLVTNSFQDHSPAITSKLNEWTIQNGIKSPVLYENAAVILSRAGNKRGAIEYARRAIQLNPYMAGPYNTLGATLIQDNRYEEALEALWMGNFLDSKYKNIWYNLGTAYSRLQLHRESAQAYESVVDYNSKGYVNYPNIYLSIAQEWLLAAAQEEKDPITQVEPDSGYSTEEVHFNRLAQAYSLAWDSVEQMKKLLAQDPDNPLNREVASLVQLIKQKIKKLREDHPDKKYEGMPQF